MGLKHIRRLRVWSLGVLAVLAWSVPALAGPVFDGVTAKTAVPPGPSASVTHKGFTAGATTTVNFSNFGPDLPLNAPPLSVARYNGLIAGGADTSRGVSDIGHFTNSADTGFAVAGFPYAMGVSQTLAGGTFTGGAAQLKNTFNLKWDIAGAWFAPLFAYQLFPLSFKFTGPGDAATFNATFIYEIDDFGDGSINTTRTLNLAVSKSFNNDGPNPFVVAYAFAYLRGTIIPAGSIVRVRGSVTMTALDPAGDVSVEFVEQLASDSLLHNLQEFYDMPMQLRQVPGGGVFLGDPRAIPEPASGLALLAAAAGLLGRRRARRA